MIIWVLIFSLGFSATKDLIYKWAGKPEIFSTQLPVEGTFYVPSNRQQSSPRFPIGLI